MPKIENWDSLPEGIRQHLIDRMRDRAISIAAVAGATSSGLDVSSILCSIGGGGVGGPIVMAIVGLIKSQMSKS
jgi:hypothetical protein